MAIIRHKDYAHGFTVINNDIINDTTLSGTARFVLIYMLQCKDDWKFSLESIVKHTGIKITRIRTAMSELQNAGYVRKTTIKNFKGRFIIHNWDISDQPIFQTNIIKEQKEKPFEIDESLLPFI